jgi:hypothetical protein
MFVHQVNIESAFWPKSLEQGLNFGLRHECYRKNRSVSKFIANYVPVFLGWQLMEGKMYGGWDVPLKRTAMRVAM